MDDKIFSSESEHIYNSDTGEFAFNVDGTYDAFYVKWLESKHIELDLERSELWQYLATMLQNMEGNNKSKNKLSEGVKTMIKRMHELVDKLKIENEELSSKLASSRKDIAEKINQIIIKRLMIGLVRKEKMTCFDGISEEIRYVVKE